MFDNVLLDNLIVSLLRGCLPSYKTVINQSNYSTYLRTLITTKIEEYEEEDIPGIEECLLDFRINMHVNNLSLLITYSVMLKMSNLLLSHLYFPVFSGSDISECRIINSRLLGSLTASSIYICTVCPRSSDPSSIVSYYKNWVNTSWLYSMYTFTLFVNKSHSNNLWPSVLEISLFFLCLNIRY